ncbi:hypothetical protein, partial [Enterobacter cloacae complex sp. 2DZ2F20B]|uniref:hypothetical protein n=1 Tax=Enterobacter cloacae complex sp. 2DZ2F20B TaxID=2511993 RepID=UPI0013EDEEA0
IEEGISKIPNKLDSIGNIIVDEKNNMRSNCINFLQNYITHSKNDFSNNLKVNDNNIVKSFLKNNPNILFTNADKRNITVAITKSEYLQKMQGLLSDRDTYIISRFSYTSTLQTEVNALITNWCRKE